MIETLISEFEALGDYNIGLSRITSYNVCYTKLLRNIWNKVVIDKENVLVAINESIPRITRELSRKADEFGYVSVNNPDGMAYIVLV